MPFALMWLLAVPSLPKPSLRSRRSPLLVNGQRFPPAQVGGGRLCFDEPVRLPSGPAELAVEIDGKPRSRALRLPECLEPARVVGYSAV